ncbi:MAG TPA: hypothetical protein DCS30_06820 [Rhizobiales bacterium]|nr:hypothetical protein [Hyphomicrobiales bacterium]
MQFARYESLTKGNKTLYLGLRSFFKQDLVVIATRLIWHAPCKIPVIWHLVLRSQICDLDGSGGDLFCVPCWARPVCSSL